MSNKFKIFLWVCSYLLLNTLITIHNKIVLSSFPFPWSLTFLHISISGFCAKIISNVSLSSAVRKHSIDNKNNHYWNFRLLLFTIINTLNIAFNNVSINSVSLTLHQVLRSSGPFVTVFLNFLLFRRKYSLDILLSLLILLLGVLLCTISELKTSFATWIGVSLTSFGVFLASFKSIVANNLTEKMSSLDLLSMMAIPCSIQCFLISAYVGEVHKIVDLFSNNLHLQNIHLLLIKLFTNALLAFGVNYTSFETNKLLGPLSIAVIANLKQVVTIAIAHFLLKKYSSQMTNLNIIGIFLSCLGGFLYGYLNYENSSTKFAYLPLFNNRTLEKSNTQGLTS